MTISNLGSNFSLKIHRQPFLRMRCKSSLILADYAIYLLKFLDQRDTTSGMANSWVKFEGESCFCNVHQRKAVNDVIFASCTWCEFCRHRTPVHESPKFDNDNRSRSGQADEP